jgi:hypothetical protein
MKNTTKSSKSTTKKSTALAALRMTPDERAQDAIDNLFTALRCVRLMVDSGTGAALTDEDNDMAKRNRNKANEYLTLAETLVSEFAADLKNAVST